LGIIPILKDMKMKGLGQPLADGIKFLLKEDFRPAGADKILFSVAPALMIAVVIVSIAVLPWGGIKQTTRIIDVTSVADGIVPAAGTPEYRAIMDQCNAIVPATGQLIGQPIIHVATGGVAARVTYRYPFQIATLNVGVLFIFAVLALAVYGVVIGGWASNNKYSFLGGLRGAAQMISYEVPLGLSLLCIILMFGTLDLGEIVDKQATYWGSFVPAWNVFCQPLAFALFLICIHAEANRAPFDLAEAEQELVGGYHTEYSSMRFALFFLSEYAGMITTSAVCVALFFGGWHLPWLEWLWSPLRGNVDAAASPAITTSLLACVIRAAVFFAKTLLVIFVFMWVRWSLPRFRFDQLMSLAWRALVPMSLALLMATALVIYFFGAAAQRAHLRVGGTMALAMLGANVIIGAASLLAARMLPAPPPTNRRLKIRRGLEQSSPVAGAAL